MYDRELGPRPLQVADRLYCYRIPSGSTLLVAVNYEGRTLKWGGFERSDDKTIVDFGKFGVFLMQVLNLRMHELERGSDSLGDYVLYELQRTSAAG